MSGGWGSNWGQYWGGFLLPSSIVPPTPVACALEFNVYCFCESDNMGDILTDSNISVVNPARFQITDNNYLHVSSSATNSSTSDAFLNIDYAVPATRTQRIDAIFHDIPPSFSSITTSHIYFGSVDETGFAAGLFISATGLAYAGGVNLDSSHVIHIGGAFQIIPGTAGLVQPDVLYRFQIAVDATTATVYIFIAQPPSPTEYDTPLTLVAILPGIANDGFATDGAAVSVCGTQVHPSSVYFTTVCLANGLLLQVPPPISNAGKDQSLRTCSIGMLDGSSSYDPEGGTLAFSWRLVDAPIGSSFEFEGSDGYTVPVSPPNGYTDKFHSSELGAAAELDPVVVGDVLVFSMQTSLPGVTPITYLAPVSVRETGVDDLGYYVQLNDNVLVDSLVGAHFKLLRQRFLTGATTIKPTFYPDIPGLYKFDLVVFNGKYLSETSYVVTNVLESQVPKGCTPDLSFVWQYLSDFWKLVEDRERIQVFWESMAQVVAAEMLTLWQVDYSKSLRDIQRTFQRRWLHYDLRLPEPVPDLTVIRECFGSVDSSVVISTPIVGVHGTVLEIVSPAHDPIRIDFPLADPYSATVLQGILQRKLQWVHPGYNVSVVDSGVLRITASITFQVGTATTIPCFTIGDRNLPMSGTHGVRVAARIYLVDRSLQGLDIRLHDLLAIGGESYRIVRVIDDSTDVHRFQRIIVESDLPLLPGVDWSLPSHVTSRLLDFYDGLVTAGDTATLELLDANTDTMALFDVPVVAACAAEVNKLAVNLASVDLYLSSTGFTARLAYLLRRTRVPVGKLVVDIPCLQEFISEKSDSAILRRNVDYYLETFRGQNSVRFVAGNAGDVGDVWAGKTPPSRMWAEVTYIDNSPTIEANFGIPAQFTLDQLAELDTDLDYLSAIQGLWYAYLNGPTMFNMRAGVQILLGLPFAEERGIIEEIQERFSVAQGRILVRDVANSAIVRSYTYPRTLDLAVNPATGLHYAVGDTIAQLAPMVYGSDVMDYVKNPTWFQGLLTQGNFLEVEKFHKFMVSVDSSVFSLSSLMFVMSFIMRVKPTYTRPIFLVKKTQDIADVSVTDELAFTGHLYLNAGLCAPNFGAVQMFDDYSPAAYGVRNQFDADSDQSTPPPIYPTPDSHITWGFDKMYLCPVEEVTFLWCVSHPGGVVPYDVGFSYDGKGNRPSYVYTGVSISDVPMSGYLLSSQAIASASSPNTSLHLRIEGGLWFDSGDYNLVVLVNSVDVGHVGFVVGPDGYVGTTTIPGISVALGDTIDVSIIPGSGSSDRSPNWDFVKVTLYQGEVVFQFDTGLPAGTYCFERTA